MMGYGMAKAAVHQLTKSLASADSGLPSGTKTFALLPITLGMNVKIFMGLKFFKNYINP